MNFTKTTEYALRILGYMSLHEDEMHTAEQLSSSLQIPKKYLQRLLTDLTKNGFLRSVQGRNGGFCFERSPKQILLSEIITSTEGISWEPKCIFGFGKCIFDNACAMHDIWCEANHTLATVLKNTHLSDLRKPNKTL